MRKRNAFNKAMVEKTSDITGFSERYIYMVLQGTRENDRVLSVYMELLDGNNRLVEAVRKAVPFDSDKELVVVYQDVG